MRLSPIAGTSSGTCPMGDTIAGAEPSGTGPQQGRQPAVTHHFTTK